ncbi:MAG: tetratricopeptide repeat protein [Planctomycetia bacterium]
MSTSSPTAPDALPAGSGAPSWLEGVRPARLAWAVVLVALVAHLGYVPGLQRSVAAHELLNYDDPQVVSLARERSVAAILGSTTYYAYKPVYFLSLKADLLLDEDGAGTGHVVNLLLFAACAGLVVVLLHALTRSAWLALGAGLLFAVHPAHVESVAWLSGRKDVLSLLLALLGHLAYRRARARGALPCLAPVLLALAGLTKGTTWTWVGLLAVDEWVERRRGGPAGALARLLPCLLVALAGIALDAVIGAQAGPGAVDHGVATGQLAAAMAGVHARYVATLLAPFHLTLDHDIDPAGSWQAASAWLGAVLAVVLAAAFVLALRRGWSVAAVALACWGLGLAPVNNLWPRTTTLMAERYLLVAALGAWLALAWLMGRLGRARGPALGVVVAALGVACLVRTGVFASSEQAWADALDKQPGSALAWVQRAQAAAERRDNVQALRWSQEALAWCERRPRVSTPRVRVQAHLVACGAQLSEGHLDELLAAAGAAGEAARTAAGKGLTRDEARRLESQAEVFRGQALEGREQPAAALEAYRRAASLDSQNASALYNLGTLLARQAAQAEGKGIDEALQCVQAARRLQPGWLDAGLQEAKLLAMAGRAQEALGLYRDLEARHGGVPELLLARAQHYLAAGPADAALREMERLRREHPGYPRAARLVADLYREDGQRLLDKARRDRAHARELLARALERAEQSVQSGPEHAEGWLLAGDVLFEQGKLLEARGRYQQALERDGSAAWVRSLAARAGVLEAGWLARRASDEALRLGAARVMAEALASGAARIDLGVAVLESELPLLAGVARRLDEAGPARTAAVAVLLASARLLGSDDPGAEEELAAAVAARPQEQGAPEVLDAALLLRGGVRARAADTEAAARDYAFVAQRRPDDPVPALRGLQVQVRAALARQSIAAGWRPRAERVAEAEALRAQPLAADADEAARAAWESAGKVLEDVRAAQAADAALEAATARVVEFADAHPAVLEAGLLAAEAEMRRQRWVDALRRLNALHERFPAQASVLRGQAAVYLNQYLVLREPSLVEEALGSLQAALALDPRDPRTALDAAGARRIAGDMKGALAWAVRARQAENLPGGPAARELAGLHAALGEQALEAGDREAALRAVAAAREVDPALPAAWLLEGRVWLELPDAKGQRDAARAIGVLMKAKELDPGSIAVDRLLARAYYQRGMPAAVGVRMVRLPPPPWEADAKAFAALAPEAQQARRDAHAKATADVEQRRDALRAQAIGDLQSSVRLDPEAEHAAQARALLAGLTMATPEEQARRAREAMDAAARAAGHLEVGEAVDAYLMAERALALDPEHRKASFYLVVAAYERLAAGNLPDEERRNVTNRAFERLQALDALDRADQFPPRHLYRALLNEALFRRGGHEECREAALRAYARYLDRAGAAPSPDPSRLEMARRRRAALEALAAPEQPR